MHHQNLLRALAFSLLALFGDAASGSITARKKTSVPRRQSESIATQKTFELRGGAFVEKTSVAQVATAVGLLQGAVLWANPQSACEGYGISTHSPLAVLTMRRLGVLLVQMGLLGVPFFNECSVQTTMGMASLGFVAEIARSVLKNEHTTIGFGLVPQLAILAQCSIVSYVNLSKQKCASTVNKANAVWLTLSGLLFALLPKWILEVGWGMSNVDDSVIGMVSGFGYWFLAYAIYAGGLAWNVDAIQSLTWNRLFILLIHFIPSRGGSIGMKNSKKMLLLVYQSIILAGLVLQDGIRCLVRCSV